MAVVEDVGRTFDNRPGRLFPRTCCCRTWSLEARCHVLEHWIDSYTQLKDAMYNLVHYVYGVVANVMVKLPVSTPEYSSCTCLAFQS